ncbi:MAG: hypothetical protein BGO77_01500 [Caedibacter sp. 37-49]|nr:MAG: hypothetical protein BGO77_01500 [Caedibacter sp. 37-49]
MLKGVSFWESLISFLVLLILPISTFSSRGVVPLFFILLVSQCGYLVSRQKHVHFKNFFKIFKRNHLFIALGLFLLWSLLSVIWSLDPRQTFQLWIKLLCLFLAGITMTVLSQDFEAHFKRRLLWSLSLGIIITNSWLLIEIINQGKLIALIKGKDFHLTSYNKALSLEVMLIWPIVASCYYFLNTRLDKEFKYLVYIFQFSFIFQTIIVVLSLDATTVKIAFLIGIIIGAFSLIMNRLMPWLLLSVCVVFFITSPLIYKEIFTSDRVANITQNFIKKPSFYHRLHIWHFVSKNILLKPLTGWGLDASRSKYFSQTILEDEIKKKTPLLNIFELELLPLHPHNFPLQMWLELGFPGIILALYLIGLILISINKIFKKKYNRAAAYAAFSTSLFVSMGSYGIWQSWWISGLWLIVIFVRFLESKDG